MELLKDGRRALADVGHGIQGLVERGFKQRVVGLARADGALFQTTPEEEKRALAVLAPALERQALEEGVQLAGRELEREEARGRLLQVVRLVEDDLGVGGE